MEFNKNQSQVLHIAMFPWLAHGHIMPFFELSKFLAQKGHKISFISTPKNLNRISNLIPQNLTHLIALVSLPLPHADGLPQGAESTSELPIHKVPFLKHAYDKLELGLTQFLRHTTDVKLIVHDFACHWLHRVTSSLGVESALFSIFGATTLAFLGSPEEIFSGNRQRPEDFTVTPRWMDSDVAIAYKLHEMVSHWDCMDSEVSDFERFAGAVQGCRFVLVRTCPEFEADSLNLLTELYGKPVLPVGVLPRSLQEGDLDYAFDRDAKWRALKEWLDGKEENSVVYIALGSELSLSRDVMHELAHGIEKSRLSFVWVVNNRVLVEGALGSDIIPPGFETRVSGRGVVWRGWAPQLRLLGHSSVGVFLTHCGWSSIIEALGLGRPLVLFPGASSDLGLISRLLAGRGVGLEIPRDDTSGSFTSDSVAGSIRRVMIDPEGEAIRVRAKSMREVLGNVELQNKHLDEVAQFLVMPNKS